MTDTANKGDMIKLVSCDGEEFQVERRAAVASRFIRNILQSDAPFQEKLKDEIRLESVRGVVLAEIVRFLEYRLRYQNATSAVPQFVLDPSLVTDVLLAADFLDV